MPPTLRQRLESALALDEGPRASLPLLLGVGVVAAASWLGFRGELDWVLRSGDAFEYAEMARRLSRGEGFTTGIVYPAELWLGADATHPAVKFPPGWPLALATAFRIAGPQDVVVHALVGVGFVTTALLAAALAMQLAGRTAGCLAGLAVATSPEILIFSMHGASEPLFGLWVTLFFLLLARGSSAPWLGLVCGLAYLTRYNGALLLPVAWVWLLAQRAPKASLFWTLAAFGAVAVPWWLRNWLVAGSPFYSILNLNLYAAHELRLGTSIFFEIDPQLPSAAETLLAKLRSQGARLLVHLPFASANLAACVGVALACVKRDRLSLAFAAFAAATLAVVALAVPLGRYFVPSFPMLLALGCAGWIRFGARLRLPALALLLVAPLLPRIPEPFPDLPYLLEHWRQQRDAPDAAPPAQIWSCVPARRLVVAEEAARLVWQTDAIAIYAPLEAAPFWRIVEAYPVAYAQLARSRLVASDRFAAHFEPRPECGSDLYERRPPPAADTSRVEPR